MAAYEPEIGPEASLVDSSLHPKKSAILEVQDALNRGALTDAHESLDKLLKTLRSSKNEKALEEQASELKFLIETHVFAGSFNKELVE